MAGLTSSDTIEHTPQAMTAEIPPPKSIGPVPPVAETPQLNTAMDEGDAEMEGQEPIKRAPFRTFTIIVALYLSMFVAALDQTIIATAIPTITMSLESASGDTW